MKTGFWPARRFSTLPELDVVYATWRDQVAHQRRHATGRFVFAERLAEQRQALRPLPPATFDFSLNRTVRVPADAYLRYAGCFYPAPVELVHQKVASAIGVVPLAPRTALSLAWATLATRAHLRRLDLSGQARLCLPLQFPRILEARRRTAVRVLWSLVRRRPLWVCSYLHRTFSLSFGVRERRCCSTLIR